MGRLDSTWPENGYSTEIDIYLDMNLADGMVSNQFQWNSAINDTTGSFLEEAFFQARTDPSTAGQWNVRVAIVGPDGFDPQPWINVTETGWYTFRHTFSEDENGLLEITLELINQSGDIVISHTFGGYSEYVVDGGSGNVGGNRYGWFSTNDFTDLPIDNAGKTNTTLSFLSSTAPLSDTRLSRLVGYWDLRDRQSYFQITNRSNEDVRIHIQLFDADNDCFEYDYYDNLTPGDTHQYDVSELDRNDGSDIAPPDLQNGHGILAVTAVDSSDNALNEPVLTGNFKIFDSAGYGYRTNLAGQGLQLPPGQERYETNFNNISGTSQSDIVVISYQITDEPGGIIPTTQNYSVVAFDDRENQISCSDIVLGCSEGLINIGINQEIVNSRNTPSLCLGTDQTGFLELQVEEDDSQTDALIMFNGLNDGNSTGSMDLMIHSETSTDIE